MAKTVIGGDVFQVFNQIVFDELIMAGGGGDLGDLGLGLSFINNDVDFSELGVALQVGFESEGAVLAGDGGKGVSDGENTVFSVHDFLNLDGFEGWGSLSVSGDCAANSFGLVFKDGQGASGEESDGQNGNKLHL